MQHQQYVNAWMGHHNAINGGMPAVDTRNPSAEYIHWYKERTMLYISNPSHCPPQLEGYQGDGSRVNFTFDIVSCMHNLSIDSLPDAKLATTAVWIIMWDMTYETLRGARELGRLSHRPSPLPVPSIEDHVEARRVHMVPRNVRGSQSGRGRRHRV